MQYARTASIVVYRERLRVRFTTYVGLVFLAGNAFSAAGQESDSPEARKGQPFGINSTPRTVDGIRVPPFGYVLNRTDDGRFPRYEGYWESNLATWPEPADEPVAEEPLSQGTHAGGPYDNAAGTRWAARINEGYREGDCAGLIQDAFRSFDDGHSGLRPRAFPQLRIEAPIGSLGTPGRDIFRPRITYGVQSYGANGKSVIDTRMRGVLQQFYEQGGEPPRFQQAFRIFYENNFLFAAPAAGSFNDQGDTFACLSPFYLHSLGISGSDARLLKPLVYASAALPPELKTRILRQGLLVPTLMYLFKSHIHGDLLSAASHVPAYALPPEAEDDYEGPAPFLDGLLNAANNLEHIPPVCRIRVEQFSVDGGEQNQRDGATYFEDNTYALSGALRRGQRLSVTLDLRFSWTDEHRPVQSYAASVLRGEATVDQLNDEGSRIGVQIPWKKPGLRTDMLLLVHDGTYYSAPAYISIQHQ
jgi:hypothetical protein